MNLYVLTINNSIEKFLLVISYKHKIIRAYAKTFN